MCVLTQKPLPFLFENAEEFQKIIAQGRLSSTSVNKSDGNKQNESLILYANSTVQYICFSIPVPHCNVRKECRLIGDGRRYINHFYSCYFYSVHLKKINTLYNPLTVTELNILINMK